MPANIYTDIMRWSATRPSWQKDALRRIILNGSLSPLDLSELHRLCREPHDALEGVLGTVGAAGDASEELSCEPLAIHHLPTASNADLSVALVRLGRLTNVNRLSPQTAIDFGPAPGLSVIYGNNGAGKSGYARVIRKACRSRGSASPIEPNVLVNTPRATPTAEFDVAINGDRTRITWTDGYSNDPHLGRILFFDVQCAEHSIQEDGGTSFIPTGLDVLTKLTQACDQISDLIVGRCRELESLNQTACKNWTFHSNTKVSVFLESLSGLTDNRKIITVASWSSAAEARLGEVRSLLASDPQQRAQQTLAAAQRIASVASELACLFEALSESSAQVLLGAQEEHNTAFAAHQVSSAISLGTEYLPGTGGDVWRQLWAAARSYSTQAAYKDQPFPFVASGACCVLCQRSYDSDTVERMRRFDAYVNNETLRTLNQKRAALEAIRLALNELPNLGKALASVQADLKVHDEGLLAIMPELIEKLLDRRATFLAISAAGSPLSSFQSCHRILPGALLT